MKFKFFQISILLIALTLVFNFETSSKAKSKTHLKSKAKARNHMHMKAHAASKHLAGKALSVMSLMSSMKHKTRAPVKKKLTLERKEQVQKMWNSTKLVENWLSITSKSFLDKS